MTEEQPSSCTVFKCFLSFLTLALLVAHARADGCFDPFADASGNGGTTYTVGSYLFGQQNGFANGTNVWYALTNTPAPPATGFPVIAAGNLTYPGIATSAGNCVSIPSDIGVMGRLTLNFVATSGQAYFAFLLKVTDISQIDTTGTQDNFFAGFGDTVGNQNATLQRAVTKIYTKKSGTGYKLGVARNTTATANWVFDTTQRNVNDVLLIVGSYDYDAHTANLWINPATNTWGAASPPAPTITATKGSDLNANGLHAFVLGCRTTPPPACLVDDLRIGTTWAIVTGGLSVVSQPVSQTLNAGTTGVFQVSASGAPPLGYQWRRNGSALAGGAKYFGATTTTLSVSNLVQADAGSYTVRITNSSGAITSAVALLTVIDPAINTPPVSLTLPTGTNAVFQVGAGGTGPLTYQWYKNGVVLANGGNISGATSAALTVSNISNGDVAVYYVVVKNSLNSTVQSGPVNLYLSDPMLPGGRPNIIFILADDLGYGDMGVLYQNARAPGLPKESTPNLDLFASEGMQLRQHYCPAPVCAPSRASLLLGVHQGHANVRDQQWDKALANNHTLASVLKTAGYATAIVGKWGLGGDDEGGTTPAQWPAFPPKRGFDYFFGYERHADGHEHYPKEAIYSNKSKECYDQSNNISSVLDKCYTCDLFTARAKKWITDQRTSQPNQPFFLYLAFDTPHSVYELPTQAYPSGGGTNGGMQWVGTPGHMINTASGTVDSYIYPDYASATYDDDGNPNTPQVAWPEVFQRYASSVRRIDDAVGDIKQLLKDLNIDSNTIVIFTSDNGPTTEDELNLPVTYAANFFDTFGPMDGVKRDALEGGIRMPMYVRWPGKIAPGTTNYTPSQSHDWMPTFTALAGLPAPARTDGVSLLPTLLGLGTQQPSTIYVEYWDQYTTPEYPEFIPDHRGIVREQMQVVGLGGYQGLRYNILSADDDFQIFDVAHDLQEATNLALQPGFAALEQQMKDRVLQLRRPDPAAPRPYDDALVPAIGPTGTTPGLWNYSVFEGDWPWVPDLAMLTPVKTGQSAGADLSVRTRDTNYAISFDGYIRIRQDGNYTFYVNDDDGALLRLHEAIVVDDDFNHTNAEASGSILLRAGLHPIHLTYRHVSGTNLLSVQYSGPGVTKQPIPVSVMAVDCTNCPITPMANDDDVTTTAGTAITIGVLTNDIAAAPLSIVGFTQPQAGTATLVGNQILYTPQPGFLGNDQFTYTITDGAAQDTATVRAAVAFSDGNYWFPFNETGGFTTTEAGGFATAELHLYTNDPDEWVTGRYNQALSFDGVSNYVTIDDFDGILGTAPRTCAAWINTTATGNMGILGWGVDASGNKWSFLVEGGSIRLEVTGGWVQGSRIVNDGQWHHVACVLPSSGSPNATNVLLYVDGTRDSVLSTSQAQSVNTTDSGEVTIGMDVQGRLFTGVIDEVRIYNSALSTAQISALYNATNQSASAWLRRYFGNATVNWNSDADGDGASLWTEYAFGGQPLISDASTMNINAQVVNGQLLLIYNRRINGTSELTYQVQYSRDLKHWQTLPGTELSVLPSGELPGFEQVTFAPNITITATTPAFVRVAVQTP